MRFNRERFFNGYRSGFGRLSQSQVDGLNFLLDKIESDDWKSIPQAAYFLATVDHETAHTFQPVKEKRERPNSPRRKNQDRYWLSGYYGRGYIQLTWRDNYAKFGLVDEPDKAYEPETAYRVAADGMRQGLFTGRKLSEFINGQKDYLNARLVVNGRDKAKEIAAIAERFEDLLLGAAELKEEPKEEAVEVKQDPPPRIEVKQQGAGITTKIAAATSAIGPVLTAAGIKIGGIELSTGGVVAIAAVIIVGMVIAAVLYDRGQQRGWEQARLSVQNLADPDKKNVVIVK